MCRSVAEDADNEKAVQSCFLRGKMKPVMQIFPRTETGFCLTALYRAANHDGDHMRRQPQNLAVHLSP